MTNNTQAGLWLGVSAAALSLGVQVAVAQTAPSAPAPAAGSVEEVIVTATRREAVDAMKVPLAVDAYSGSTLQKLQITSESDLAKVDPSLDIQAYGAVDERIIIRGISSDVGATTGVYLDEITLQGGFNDDVPGDNTPTVGLWDIDHVEVLKGPQGTLFGAGSMDGTVRIVTKQPDLSSYGGWVDLSEAKVQHGDGSFQGAAGFNLPLVDDKFGLRFVGWGDNGGGYINQIIEGNTLDHVNDTHMYGFRAEALWKPNDKFSLLATAVYQETHVDGQQFWTQYVGGNVSPYSPFIGPYPAYTDALPSQTPFHQNFQLYSLTGKYDLGFGSIIASTAYGRKDELSITDTSAQDCIYDICEAGGAYPPAAYSAHPTFWYSATDVRFASAFKGPVQIVAGLYYEYDHSYYQGTVVNVNAQTGTAPCYTWSSCGADGLITPGLVKPGQGVSAVQFSNASLETISQFAFYTQADWKILPDLTATAGIRYFTSDIRYSLTTLQNIAPTGTPTGFDCGYVLGCVTTPYLASSQRGTESQPTYNFSLLWAATPDVSVYGRIASGFRLGGLNEAATIAAQANLSIPSTYGPDSLWDYEAGVKTYFFDRKLYVDVTGFHIDWSNEQETGVAYGIYDYTLNVGRTSVNGAEVDTTWRPQTNLTFSGGFTYVDATLASDLPASVASAGTPGTKGDQMPFVPHWIINSRAEYEHPVANGYTGYLVGDLSYHGSSYSAFEPSTAAEIAANVNDYDTKLPAYVLVDLKAGVRWGHYDASIFVHNLTDAVAWVGANPTDAGVGVYSAPPRTIGVRVAASF
jgi:outer membrane receptor protein involved in Fe transport